MTTSAQIRWPEAPREQDHAAAPSFLSMLVDVLRAAALPPLEPGTSAEAVRVRMIANGHDGASAAYKVGEDAEVPGRRFWLT